MISLADALEWWPVACSSPGRRAILKPVSVEGIIRVGTLNLVPESIPSEKYFFRKKFSIVPVYASMSYF